MPLEQWKKLEGERRKALLEVFQDDFIKRVLQQVFILTEPTLFKTEIHRKMHFFSIALFHCSNIALMSA